MDKMLIIAEKPSVAKEIAAALGGFASVGDWKESATVVVSSAIGHLVEIYSPEAETAKSLASLPVIPTQFASQAIPKTKAQFALLTKLMRRSDIDVIVNACDAGREGELIFRLIYELAGCRKPVKRMWLQSMTPSAIRDGYATMRPGTEFDNLSDAAKCRNEADWLIGINGTRGISRLREQQTQSFEVMAAGRVQTPTLAILVRRENEIENFIPKDYWEVQATFGTRVGSYVGKWFNVAALKAVDDVSDVDDASGSRLFDRARAEGIVARCRGVAPSSVKDVSQLVSKAPPKLYDLTSLQREANQRYKFSAKKTLDIAQALYEKHKATSYPRTDSSALPEDYIEKIKEVLGTFGNSMYGLHAERVLNNAWVKPEKRIFDNTKISDHFAIIPTGLQPSGLDDAESKIYDMVVRRFIAVFHPSAEYNLTTRISIVSGESFKTTGKVLVKRGWLEVYGQSEGDDKTPLLCEVVADETVRTDAIEVLGKQTQPPSRHTEASLLTAMEGAGKTIDDEALREAMKELGLGTPATRANIIEGLLSDKDGQKRPKEPYVVREGEEVHLVPTKKGSGLVDFLDSNGIEFLTSARMTGEWERKLRLMERGQYRRAEFMAEIGATTRGMIDVIREKAGALPVAQRHAIGVACPKCGGDMFASDRLFDCHARCGFSIRREICKRELSESEGVQLFRDGEIKQLDGFISPKTGKAFSCGLKLNTVEWKADFVFEERAIGGVGVSNVNLSAPELGAPCPKCGGKVRDQGRLYACDKGDFKLWKDIAGKALTSMQALRLIKTRQHPKIEGFTSSKGKSFGAALRLSKDFGKVEFVFE